MKIVLGTANFYNRYGVSNSKIKNVIELKKILNFLKRKKIRYIDTAFSYNLNNKFRNKIDLSSFKIITKFKLPIKNKKLFIKNLNLKIENELKIFGINKFEAILLHNTNDLNSKYSDELISKLKELKKKKLVKNLNSHLMKNLSIKGVPRVLNNTVFPFEYNNINQLKKIIDKKNIGIVKMEVQRNVVPKKNFLKEVREICDKKKIVLIFDECTSGFRSCYGGLHLKYKINPDISIFGKALGNGHAINAIIGKKEIMENIKDTFISSTFWTERLGSVAGLETLKLMKKIESWKINSKIGANIKKNWNQIARENSLRINVQGIDSLPNFIFNSKKHNLYKTYISQQMIKKKIMASNVVYTCISHTNKILDNYFDNLNNIFKMIKKCDDEKENIYNLLKTNEAITGIRSN